MNVIVVLVSALAAAVASIVSYLVFTRRKSEAILAEAGKKAEEIRDSAARDGEAKIREAELVAKERLLQARNEFEKFSRKRRSEHEAFERRLLQKEDNLDKRQHDLNRREQETGALERTLSRQEKTVAQRQEELDAMISEERQRLEQLSGLTAQQAKDELIRVMEKEARNEAAHLVKRIDDEANEQATRQAQRIIANAIQRNASDYVAETTVSVVLLPNDEMKGRIIGREGRNIRALEMATGVDLIVDDTPEAVILSGFDPFRREIARVALERLITDGRIHPARIEEVVEKVKGEFDVRVQQEGDAALLELNIPDLHPELVKLLGKLRFRTSYGQNVLKHSKEVAYLAATMAAELRVDVHVAKRAGLLHDIGKLRFRTSYGQNVLKHSKEVAYLAATMAAELRVDVHVAKRAGLLHDIGKAVDREMEGSHLELGIDLLRKFGESETVVHAMACHHGDYDPQTVEAVLVTAADALSAARPGARREVLESYIKRLEKLEEISNSFKGVQKSFAIQAGREVRVIVDSGKLSDEDSIWLAKNVAKKVESELTYPGEIKVTVIRETRSIEFAR